MEPTRIHRTKVYALLHSTRGMLFSVDFIKKDGSHRHLTGMIKPPKPHPKRPAPASDSNSYLLMWDMSEYKKLRREGVEKEKASDSCYRLVNMETIFMFHYKKVYYVVVD